MIPIEYERVAAIFLQDNSSIAGNNLASRLRLFDQTCQALNLLMQNEDTGHLPNIYALKASLPQRLSTFRELIFDGRARPFLRAAFKETDEFANSSIFSPPEEVKNEKEELSSILLIAGYGYFLNRLYDNPSLAPIFALAFLDTTLLKFPTSRLSSEVMWWTFRLKGRLESSWGSLPPFPQSSQPRLVGGTRDFAVLMGYSYVSKEPQFNIQLTGFNPFNKMRSAQEELLPLVQKAESLMRRAGEVHGLVSKYKTTLDPSLPSALSIEVPYDDKYWPTLMLGVPLPPSAGKSVPSPKRLQELVEQQLTGLNVWYTPYLS